jgi:hypothetical protein
MTRILFCLAVAVLVLPSISTAMDIDGQSRTYLQYRQETDSTRLLPLYEYIDLRAATPNTGAISFNVGGWYRQDLQNESPNGKNSSDLQYAYLSLRKEKSNAGLDIGRVLVRQGVSSELVDGVQAKTDLIGGFGISAYAGSPVSADFDTRRGDSIAGGRFFHSLPNYYTLGVSYLDEKNADVAFRREEGVDLWLHPVSFAELQGQSSYNAMTKEWMQHNYVLTLGPAAGVRMTALASKVTYKDFFTGATTSALAFPKLDPNEIATTTGGILSYSPTRAGTLSADYKNIEYHIAGKAQYYGGNASYAGSTYGAGLKLHQMRGESDTNRYDEQRAYVTAKMGRSDLSLQGMHVAYKAAISGVKDAYNAGAAAGYAFSPKARAIADVEYAKNPYFNKDVRGMLTFVYNFGTK